MKIILYSTGCPRCEVLKKKLIDKGVKYSENNSVEEMLRLDIREVPALLVESTLMSFGEAVDWVNSL